MVIKINHIYNTPYCDIDARGKLTKSLFNDLEKYPLEANEIWAEFFEKLENLGKIK